MPQLPKFLNRQMRWKFPIWWDKMTNSSIIPAPGAETLHGVFNCRMLSMTGATPSRTKFCFISSTTLEAITLGSEFDISETNLDRSDLRTLNSFVKAFTLEAIANVAVHQ
ncbi:hypothetical protein Ae201684_009728 [Aphanomyces euteiches]|uniref:Uncharacterized protein n=1 Tax=Aphanomyces euteiches TaxID=100861 RepID=A0A6G0X141_9STRA|nr:hypothetical protein Ae201684_009728 [Aphanomyces euteiches]